MTNIPPEIERVLRLIHDTVDRSIDSEIQRLEASRSEKHAEADRFFGALLQGTVPSMGAPTSAVPNAAHTNGNGRTPFALKESILSLIEPMAIGAKLSQRTVYTALTAQHPELKDRPETPFRGQIVGVLGKLEAAGYIETAKRGVGGTPNVYKKIQRSTDE